MSDKRDPTELIDELKWLSKSQELKEAWKFGADQPDVFSAEEYFCVLFDDLNIEKSKEIYNLDSTSLYYIEVITNHLNNSLRPKHTKLNVNSLLINPNFRIAQKICELL